MDRIEILNYINKVIKKERGKEVTEESMIADSGIDSFSYAILWLSLENKYGKFYNDEIEKIPVSEIKVGQIIDKVVENVVE